MNGGCRTASEMERNLGGGFSDVKNTDAKAPPCADLMRVFSLSYSKSGKSGISDQLKTHLAATGVPLEFPPKQRVNHREISKSFRYDREGKK